MDNIKIKEIWRDGDIVEWQIMARAENIQINQQVYTQESTIKEMCKKIQKYLKDNLECYIEIGNKNTKYTPSFSLKLEKPLITGTLLIELDMEITDSINKEHRCVFYINTDLGALERFVNNLEKGNSIVSLYDE